MEHKIAIVHTSEIVRKGLAALLGSFWRGDILQFAGLAAFRAGEGCRSCRTLLFAEAGQLEEGRPSQHRTTLVALFDTAVPEHRLPGVAGQAHLRTGFEEFRRMVEDFAGDRAGEPQNSETLTQREREVLQQVALGLSNREIAHSLHISIHTVTTHRKNITGKLGIRSISGLTVYAILNRLIDPAMIDPEALL